MWKNFKEKPFYQQVIVVVIALAALYLIVVNLDRIFETIGDFLSAISPFIMGAAIAYLLNKPSSGIQSVLEKSQNEWVVKKARILSVFLVFLLLFTGISLVINLVAPIIVNNVRDFAENVPEYYNLLVNWVNNSGNFIYGFIPDLGDNLLDLITPELINQLGIGATQFAGHVMNITTGIFNIFLAMIAALYMLITKDNIMALIRRIMKLFMNDSTYNNVASYAAKSNRIFYKFVGAQFLDACILGTLATIILVVLRVPYAITFGILLGVCNMIPIFGSIFTTAVTTVVTIFTGGVPLAIGTFIALLILQQIDANFIGPKITGDALGLKPLLIIFAIVIGGRYANIIGMFVAVPIAAMLKMFLEDFMDAREKKLKARKVAYNDDA